MSAIAATLVYNTPGLAASMRKQLPEIVIVDNASQLACDHDISFDENFGFVRGWNRFMKMAASFRIDYVWMLNSDLEGIDQWVMEDVLWPLENYKNRFAVTPTFNSPHAAFHYNPALEKNSGIPATWLDWCCPMVNVKHWIDLGGFDERSTGYFADVDICHRARLKGLSVEIINQPGVHHIGQQTINRAGKMWDIDETWLREKWGVSSWMELT